MATIETISLSSREDARPASIREWRIADSAQCEGLPQICWKDGAPWREVNVWLLERFEEKSPRTALANATSLHAYAQWLEKTQTNWKNFPARKRDRCVNLFRGALIEARDNGLIAPSTATSRMRSVIQFYRWSAVAGLSPNVPAMFDEETVLIRLHDAAGFNRFISSASTTLAIPNRSRHGTQLEDGLMPLSEHERDAVLRIAKEFASTELLLMLVLGFMSGLRLGSICDLKVQTIFNAATDPLMPGISYLAVGPGARPNVATKFGVTGRAMIPTYWLSYLKTYCYSQRRIKREALAAGVNKNLVFLTRFGSSYALRPGADKSSSINTEMHRLRAHLQRNGVKVTSFRFHQTRATFATSLAQIALQHLDPVAAIGLVREMLLHRNEATTLRYLDFAKTRTTKVSLANEFSELLMGWLPTIPPQ